MGDTHVHCGPEKHNEIPLTMSPLVVVFYVYETDTIVTLFQ